MSQIQHYRQLSRWYNIVTGSWTTYCYIWFPPIFWCVRKDYNPLKRRRTNSPEPGLVDDDNFRVNDNFNDAPEVPESRQHSDVDDADDKEDHNKWFIDLFPGAAGEALRHEKTCFENLQHTQQLKGETPWAPFANKAEWGLAEWLMWNVGQKSTDEYLQLLIVSWHLCSIWKNSLFFKKIKSHQNLSFHNNYTFLKKIDQLSTGPECICNIVTITGNLLDKNGVRM